MGTGPGDFIETIAAGMPLFDKAEIAAKASEITGWREKIAEALTVNDPFFVVPPAIRAMESAENRLALMLLHNRLLMKEV